MGKIMLEVRDLKTKYITRFHEDVYSVDGVSFKIEEGKSLGIAGESGCGKSTLALSLMGYYFPPLHYISGDIIIDGKNISGMDPDTVRKNVLGTEIAYIPQAAMNALNPTRKIYKFIEDVILAHDPKANKKEIHEMAEAPLRRAGPAPGGAGQVRRGALRRHEAARGHRHLHHPQAQGADRRRALLGAGRDQPEDGHQDDARDDGQGHGEEHDLHHPRAAPAVQRDRRHHGHVRRPDRGAGHRQADGVRPGAPLLPRA